jgi:hypothetical protein
MPLKLTRQIAVSAGVDAANRHMRSAGRTEWSWEDPALAVTITGELLMKIPFEDAGLNGIAR